METNTDHKRFSQIERLDIKNCRGELLAGWLHRPIKGRVKKLVIVCHGFGSSAKASLIKDLCEEFCKAGYAAYRFNFSGITPSQGKAQDSSYSIQAQDLCSVCQYFSDRSVRTKNQFTIDAIVGHSMGGTAAIIHASSWLKHHGEKGPFLRPFKGGVCLLGTATDVPCSITQRPIGKKDRYPARILVLVAPRIVPGNSMIIKALTRQIADHSPEKMDLAKHVYSMHKDEVVEIYIRSRSYRFSKAYIEDMLRIDVKRELRNIQKSSKRPFLGRTLPVHIIYGSKDKVVSRDDLYEARFANSDIIFSCIEGADHSFKDGLRRKELCNKVKEIIKGNKHVKIKLGILATTYGLLIASLLGSSHIPFTRNISPLSDPDILMVFLVFMSSLSLSYVSLVNRLRDKIRKQKKELQDYRNASWIAISLVHTAFMFFLTIVFVLIRIGTSMTHTAAQIAPFLDWHIFLTFLLGSFMRLSLFIESHYKNFWSYPVKLWRL